MMATAPAVPTPDHRSTDRAGGRSGRRRIAGVVVVIGVFVALVLPAAAASQVFFATVVNGQPAATSSDAHPAQLYPHRPTQVAVAVTNRGGATVRVSTIRFTGEVLGLPLFSFDTAVNLAVAPRSTRDLTFPVSMSGIGSQATGLVPATLVALTANGTVIASQSIVTNVHGSIWTIYGLFALAVLILTITSLVLGLLALARHTLPQNRWLRGVRFLVPGFGVGLILIFTLAVLGIFTPAPTHWLPLMIVTSAIGFALGYLTPAPNEEDLEDDDVMLAQIIVVDEDPLEAPLPADVVAPAGGVAPDSRSTVVP
jgi:hypothetical protein